MFSDMMMGAATASPPVNNAIIIGDGKICRSTDSGATWAQVATISGATYKKLVYCGSDIFVGARLNGGTCTVFRTNDGGDSWTDVATNPGLVSGVQSLAFSTGVLIATGVNRTIMRSTDLGSSWTQVLSVGAPHALNQAASNGAGRWIAVGDYGVTYTSTDDGITWSAGATVPSMGGEGYCLGIEFISGSTWVVCGRVDGSTASGSAVTTNNGASWGSWVQTEGGTFGFYRHMTDMFYDGTALVGVGPNGGMVRSTNAGTSWANPTSKPFSTGANDLDELKGISGNASYMVAVGVKGQVARSVDHGLTWSSLLSTTISTSVSVESVAVK